MAKSELSLVRHTDAHSGNNRAVLRFRCRPPRFRHCFIVIICQYSPKSYRSPIIFTRRTPGGRGGVRRETVSSKATRIACVCVSRRWGVWTEKYETENKINIRVVIYNIRKKKSGARVRRIVKWEEEQKKKKKNRSVNFFFMSRFRARYSENSYRTHRHRHRSNNERAMTTTKVVVSSLDFIWNISPSKSVFFFFCANARRERGVYLRMTKEEKKRLVDCC